MDKQYIIELAKASGIRALRSFCQVFGAMLTVGAKISEIDWKSVLSVAVVAAVYSIMTSVVTGLPEVDKNDDKED